MSDEDSNVVVVVEPKPEEPPAEPPAEQPASPMQPVISGESGVHAGTGLRTVTRGDGKVFLIVAETSTSTSFISLEQFESLSYNDKKKVLAGAKR